MFHLYFVIFCFCAIFYEASVLAVLKCDPASHICEGRCPDFPYGDFRMPSGDEQEGVCLKDATTDACVCWLINPTKKRMHTIFTCKSSTNSTKSHMMCVPPSYCFPPRPEPGCLILLKCPCLLHSSGKTPLYSGRWQIVQATVLRSNVPATESTEVKEGPSENSPGDVREFGIKHLLFLLAFVIAPLLCWCLLTFFHEGKCRRKSRTAPPEEQPMPIRRDTAEEPEMCLRPRVSETLPSAPKFENPPPYQGTIDPSENCLLPPVIECGPPPPYEDAVREHWQVVIHRPPEAESD